jgi:hypothetical protein
MSDFDYGGRNIDLAFRDIVRKNHPTTPPKQVIRHPAPPKVSTPKVRENKPNYYYDKKVVDFVNEYWKRNYRSPSVREIMKAVGINSTSSTVSIIHRCAEKEGWSIDVVGGTSRSIVPDWVKQAIADFMGKKSK